MLQIKFYLKQRHTNTTKNDTAQQLFVLLQTETNHDFKTQDN